ncbi:MAG: hypothetical protein JWM73_2479 [Solirubrobacterales bacterium]|nr:hypothetical protein [Solirubrobacterales bacterium]
MRPRRFLALGALLLCLPVVPARAAAAPITRAGPVGRVALDGPWVVRGDRANAGIARNFGAGHWSGRTVTVPFSPNANPHRLTGKVGIANHEGSIAWFRTRFAVQHAGRYAIDFESVNHRATVWIDGRRIGVSHDGEFQPFSKHFRAAGPGEHLLVVRADYSGVEQQNLTGWHRTWFNFGGIQREVTVRPVGRSDIADPTLTTTLTSTGTALVDVTARLRNHGAARSIALVGTLGHGAQEVRLAFPRVRVGAGATRAVHTRVRVTHPALWSPEDPQLYDLALQVAGEAGWAGRTGLRQLSWKGRRIYLNGRHILLHGASLHEDAYGRGNALTAADMDGFVADLKAIGANMTRAHHPLSPALLERLDAAGILVWQEIGNNDAPGGWALKTAELRRAGRRRVRQSFFQLQLHPSIMVWSLANEIAGGGHRGGQARYIDNVAQELHRRDPDRLVGVDIWGIHVPDSDRGLLIYRHLDVVGLTNYDGWYNDNDARGARLRRIIQGSVSRFARAFPDKLMMVTEFGAEANPHNATAAAGGYAFQTRLLRAHLAVYGGDPRVAGMLIWILRDFAVPPSFAGGSIRREVPGIHLVRGIAQKGLYDYRGRPKPAMAAVAAIFGAIPTFPDG